MLHHKNPKSFDLGFFAWAVQDSNSSGADCNDDERRQRRKQRGVVGAAASDTQARRSGCWVPQPVCLRRKQGGEAGAAF